MDANSFNDPRFEIHPPSMQQLPGTYPKPRTRLSHSVKAIPSPIKRRDTESIEGLFAPIATRIPLPAFVRRKGLGVLRVLDPDEK